MLKHVDYGKNPSHKTQYLYIYSLRLNVSNLTLYLMVPFFILLPLEATTNFICVCLNINLSLFHLVVKNYSQSKYILVYKICALLPILFIWDQIASLIKSDYNPQSF